MNEAEKLQANSGHYISTYVHSERDIDMTAEQWQNKDCTDNSTIEVTNSIVSAAPHTADEQYNIRATESTDVGSNCVTVSRQHTSSTNVNNLETCEEHSTQFSNNVSVLEADNDSCHKNSNAGCTDAGTKSVPVSVELRISKSLPSTVKQSQVQLQPKPTFTLLPVRLEVPLLVMVNTSGSQTNDRHLRLPTIAPRPVDTISGNACMPAVSQEESAVVGHCDSLLCDLSVPRMQQKAVASVITQTSSCAHLKNAATQTSALMSRLSKESRASQVMIILVIVVLIGFQKKNICLITTPCSGKK